MRASLSFPCSAPGLGQLRDCYRHFLVRVAQRDNGAPRLSSLMLLCSSPLCCVADHSFAALKSGSPCHKGSGIRTRTDGIFVQMVLYLTTTSTLHYHHQKLLYLTIISTVHYRHQKLLYLMIISTVHYRHHFLPFLPFLPPNASPA